MFSAMWILVPAIPYQRLPSTTEIGSSQNWRGRMEHVRFHSQHPPWFNYHNNARGRQQTVKLLAINSSHYYVSSSSLRSQHFFFSLLIKTFRFALRDILYQPHNTGTLLCLTTYITKSLSPFYVTADSEGPAATPVSRESVPTRYSSMYWAHMNS